MSQNQKPNRSQNVSEAEHAVDSRFNYEEAFSRNLGWVNEWEQALIRDKRVAIAGMGGVGGAHLLALSRLGVGNFHIADFDHFEVANFNRQAGGMMSNVGRAKVDAMAEAALDINPTSQIKKFSEGVTLDNIDDFLEGVDLYVDSLDTFAIEIRRAIFRRCAAKGIWSISAAPIGMSAAYVSFAPGGMTFEQYFQMDKQGEVNRVINLIAGMGPNSPHGAYLVEPERMDLARKKVASTGAACQLCAGVVTTEATKIFLGRGKVEAAPHFHQFDAYTNTWKHGKLRLGNAGPMQRIKRALTRRFADKLLAQEDARPEEVELSTVAEKILDLTRWAPSGDNNQPWRFEVVDQDNIRITLQLPEDDVYDLRGEGTILSGGFLMETLRQAASRYGRSISYRHRATGPFERTFDVVLSATDQVEDPCSRFIKARSVDRGRYALTPLTYEQKRELSDALGDEFEIRFFESFADKMKVVKLTSAATDIRLRIPEALEVHRRILDFKNKRSKKAVPASAVGLSTMSLKVLQWAMGDEARMDRLMSLMGTGANRLEMDLIPGLSCGAQFMIALKEAPKYDRTETLVRAGEAVQRMWLQATRLGLVMQPGYAPVAFSRYIADGVKFTRIPHLQAQAEEMALQVYGTWASKGPDKLMFAGRLGTPLSRHNTSRSVRRSLGELMVRPVSSVSERRQGRALISA